MKENELYKSID